MPAGIEKGQTITADVAATLTAFNDALGRSKDRIAFPKDDVKQIPAQPAGAYACFAARLNHLAKDDKPVPNGLQERVDVVLKQYPYDWAHFGAFEKAIPSIGAELAKSMVISTSVGASVVETFRSVFKRRRSMKLKGFGGLPHPKEAGTFDFFHEFRFGGGGLEVERLNLKGSASLRLGDPASPELSGHPLMHGRKAALRLLRSITFTIEGIEVTFAMMMHRPPLKSGLLKQWRLFCRKGEYWVNFMLEIPAYAEPTSDAGGVTGLDLNWRVLLSGGILLGMLADGSEDTMIVFDMDRSARNRRRRHDRHVFGRWLPRWLPRGRAFAVGGRNNLRNGVNYGVPDTFAGSRQIRELRDKAKDKLKFRIERILSDETPSYLSLCGARGLKQLAHEFDDTHPDASAENQQWAIHDADLLRVTRKLSKLLNGRLKRGYEQLAHHLCSKLSKRGIRRIAIEENFLKHVAEAEKKYQPEAIQRSACYRHSLGLSHMIATLEHIGRKYGIVLCRHKAAYTTSRCRFCRATIEFGAKRTAECHGCSRIIDQDQNAAHNLRNAELDEIDVPAAQ